MKAKPYVVKKPSTVREIRRACGVTAEDIRKADEILKHVLRPDRGCRLSSSQKKSRTGARKGKIP